MRILRKNFNKFAVVLVLMLMSIFSFFAMGFVSPSPETVDVTVPLHHDTYIRPAGGGVYHYFEAARAIKFYEDNLYVLNRNGSTNSHRYELVIFYAPDGDEATIDDIPIRIRIPTPNSVTQFQRYGNYLFTIERSDTGVHSLVAYDMSQNLSNAQRVVSINPIEGLGSTDILNVTRYTDDFDDVPLDFPIRISSGDTIRSLSTSLAWQQGIRYDFAPIDGIIQSFTSVNYNFFGVFGSQSNRVGFIPSDTSPIQLATTPAITNATFIGITPINPVRSAALTANSLRVFYPEGSVLMEDRDPRILNVSFASPAIDICSSEKFIFVLTENGGIIRVCNTTFHVTPLISSMGTDDGLFHNPVDIATRGSNEIAIADRANDRIVIYDGETFRNFTFTNPIAVTAGIENFYVAHAGGVCRINSSFNVFPLPMPTAVTPSNRIKDIAVNGRGSVYILTYDGLLFRKPYGHPSFIRVFNNIRDIVSIDSSPINHINTDDFIYAVIDDGQTSVLKLFNDDTVVNVLESVTLSKPLSHVKGIAADPFGGFYIMMIPGPPTIPTRHYIQRFNFEKVGEGNEYVASYRRYLDITGEFNRIHVSSVAHIREDGSGVLERDILAANTLRHTVQIIRSTEFGVQPPIDVPPVAPSANPYDENNPDDVNRRIIHYITANGTRVHSRPSQAGKIEATLNRYFRVIVPLERVPGGFTKILADNLNGNNLIVGYVLDRFISDPPEVYSNAIVSLAGKEVTVYRDGASVHHFPSRQSALMSGYSSLDAGDKLEVLGFIYSVCDLTYVTTHGFLDNFGENARRWLRVKINGFEGFIYEGDVIIGVPPSAQFNDNATIVTASVLRFSSRGETLENTRVNHHAYIFERTSRGMEFDKRFIDENDIFVPLLEGDRVEVVNRPFDNSTSFTRIRFIRDGLIFEGYVQTAHINFDGVNLTQIVAGTILGTTGTLGGILGFRYIKLRRRRMLGGLA